jgi:hypothetical protein
MTRQPVIIHRRLEKPPGAASFFSSAELDRAYNEISRLQHVVSELHQAIASERSRHDMVINEYHAKLDREAEHQYAMLEVELATQEARFRHELEAQQAKIEKYELELQHAQLTSFTEMARPTSGLEEDSTIEEAVHLLHKNLWSWAKAHSLRSMDDVRITASEDAAALDESLATAGVDLGLFRTQNSAAVKKMPALLLAAVAAKDIYATMFQNPFFFFDSVGFETANPKRHALQEALEVLEQRARSPCTFREAILLSPSTVRSG